MYTAPRVEKQEDSSKKNLTASDYAIGAKGTYTCPELTVPGIL